MKKFITSANVILFALIIMIALNLVSLYMLHTTRESLKGKWQDMDHVQITPQSLILKKLNFSGDQITAYEALVRNHRKITKETKDDIRELKKRLYGLLYLEPKSPEVIQLLNEISDKERSLDEETFEHFRRVRDLCNEEQKKKFESVINQVIDMKSHGMKRGELKMNR